MISNFDREEIIRTWSIFRQPGEVTELRILNAGWNKTISGYFDDPKKFADSVVGLADEPFPAYYFVINPVSSELMARAANRYIKKAKNTTADKDIVALHWLPVDIDPQRPAGMSSTDAEHNAAITKAREIRGWLQERGWPGGAFVLADSGNGAHLSVRIELPNDRPSRALVKRCLEALHTKFSDEITHVDTTTHNPARIWKIYGTMARKGSSTATRPHRLAHILELPESLEVVPGALLEALGGTAAVPDPEKKKAAATKRAGVKRWNLAEVNAFVEPHGIHILGEPKVGMDWTVFELDQCPFNPEHNRGEACLSVNNQSGIIAFKCQHDSCKDKKIEDLYELWITEPLSSISGNVFQEFTRDEFVDGKGKDENGEPISEHFSPTKAAAAILSRVDLRIASWEVNNREKEPDIWSCGDNGIWSRDGEQFIDEICDIMAEDLSTKWTLQETKRRIRNAIRGEPAEFDTGTPNLVGTKNGYACNLLTGEVRKICPEDNISSDLVLPVDYDKNSRCPAILDFYDSICNDDCTKMAFIDDDVATLHLANWSYILLHLGLGGNGKGARQKFRRAFFGDYSIANIGLKALNNDQFALSECFRKRVLNCGETRKDEGKGVKFDTTVPKRLTGDDAVAAPQKYKNMLGFEPFAKFSIDANNPLRFDDDSTGFLRRFRRGNLPYYFATEAEYDATNPTHKHRDADIVKKLTTPEEMAGYLNLLLDRAKDIVAKREYPGCPHLTEGYEEQTYSIDDFVTKYCQGDDATAFITAKDLYDRFKKWATFYNMGLANSTVFGTTVHKLTGVKSELSRRSGYEKPVVRGYDGIDFDYEGYEKDISEISKSLTVTTCNKSVTSIIDSSNKCNECNRLSERYYILREKYGSNMVNHDTTTLPSIIHREVSEKPVTTVKPVTDIENPVTIQLQPVTDSDFIKSHSYEPVMAGQHIENDQKSTLTLTEISKTRSITNSKSEVGQRSDSDDKNDQVISEVIENSQEAPKFSDETKKDKIGTKKDKIETKKGPGLKFTDELDYALNKAEIHCAEQGIPINGLTMSEYLKEKNIEIAPRMCDKWLKMRYS